MHFLIDASLPRAVNGPLLAGGHQATDVRDVGLRTAADRDIAEFARTRDFAILSADHDFGNIQEFPPADYAGIVVIEPPVSASCAIIVSIVERFIQRLDIVAQLPGRLAVVDSSRIRLRPAP